MCMKILKYENASVYLQDIILQSLFFSGICCFNFLLCSEVDCFLFICKGSSSLLEPRELK